MLDEELLAVWLRLTSVIDNQRLAGPHAPGQSRLSFNEALVCGLLAQAADGSLTASELCRRTRILKSQMNAILRSLERKGAISRRPSETDRRLVELRLLPEGLALYRESHQKGVAMTERLIHELGEEKAADLLSLLRQTADIFETIQQEV